jgi:hypothetical protein
MIARHKVAQRPHRKALSSVIALIQAAGFAQVMGLIAFGMLNLVTPA